MPPRWHTDEPFNVLYIGKRPAKAP
jgi:hypothetical protein